MGYAVRNDGLGWRAVNGPDDVGADEIFSADVPTVWAAQVKAAKWDAIKAERDRRTEQGGYKAGDHWFHSDAKSRGQQHDNESMGTDLAPVQWKTMSGDFVTMTPGLAAQIRVARMASDRAIFNAAEAHRSAMEASTDPSAYDFSGGWPKAFGE